MEVIIPNFVSEHSNRILTLIPINMEIKEAVMNLKRDSSPGPYSFGAIFFQEYWDIIGHDVTKVMTRILKDD